MTIPVSQTVFMDAFPETGDSASRFGFWADESDRTHWYYVNAKGDVGEVIYEPRTTRHLYGFVCGEPAEILKSLYGKW